MDKPGQPVRLEALLANKVFHPKSQDTILEIYRDKLQGKNTVSVTIKIVIPIPRKNYCTGYHTDGNTNTDNNFDGNRCYIFLFVYRFFDKYSFIKQKVH